MYNESFGLRKNPFNLTPDPSFLYLTDQHREALVGLTYAILQRKGFVVLTGEAGTGKTTLLARVLQFLPSSQLQFSVILNPTLTPSEFLEYALMDFGVKDIPASKAQRLWKLKDLLLQAEREGKVSALIVDEAHKLSAEVLEEIRMLGNFEGAEEKLLQFLLIGQPELDQTLERGDLRQMKQRIALRLSLARLSRAQVGEYIRHRWVRAGGTEHPFSAEAVEDIAQVSQCIPRVINAVCDNALISAFAEQSPRVLDRHVREAAASLDLHGLSRRPIAARPAGLAPAAPPTAPPKTTPPSPVISPSEPKLQQASRGSKWERWSRWAGRLRFTPRPGNT